MNAFDLAAMKGVLVELDVCVEQLAGLTQLPPDPGVDVAELHAQIETIRERIGLVTRSIQDRACRRWREGDHRPRHAAPAWIRPKREGLPLSTEVDPGAQVQRMGITGRPVAEERAERPRWNSFRDAFAARTRPGGDA